MSVLVKYDAACRAVADAVTVDEAKDIRDKADAMRAYARQAKNKQLEVQAAEIRIKAERRIGEVMAAQREAELLSRGAATEGVGKRGFKENPRLDQKATLAEAGIDKNLADRARKLAAIPEGEFEAIVADWRGRVESENARVTVNLIKAGKRAERVAVAAERDTCTTEDLNALVRAGKRYGCVYADPPWLYSNQATRASTGNHYDGMTVDEICALPIRDLALDDAHLHLWITNGFLFEAPKIFDAWGFEFRSTFVWVKPQMGIGNYWRNSHEMVLTAIRGNAKRFNDKSLKSWGQYDRGRHSSKPEQIRGAIEKASSGPYLELFGRSAVSGWAVWGNEVDRGLLFRDAEIAA